jgi:hypothetical protein
MSVILVWSEAKQPYISCEDDQNSQSCPDKRLGMDLRNGHLGTRLAYRKSECRKLSTKRTLGLCLEQRLGLLTLVPRTCAVRHALEAWGQQQGQ